jgi:transcriptional regulator with XRE-family HTH domain
MSRNGTQRLAEVLNALFQDRDVSIAHVVRVAHMSRNTITSMRHAKPHQPDPDVFRRIGLAFGTNPKTGAVDTREMTRVNEALSAAYGYATPDAEATRTLLEMALLYELGSQAGMRAWLDLFRTARDLPLADVHALADELRRRDDDPRPDAGRP